MNSDSLTRLEEADRFVALRANSAFQQIMDFLAKEVEAAKGKAILNSTEVATKVARRDIIAWQEREKIYLSIESILEEHAETKRLIEEGEENERRIAAERASRANW